MRVAYIGNFQPEYSTENDVRKAFEYLGHAVTPYQENNFRTAHMRALLNGPPDLLLITSTWDTAINLSEWLGFTQELAKLNVPTATLHLDIFWGTGRNNRKWWLNPMFHTSHIFTADGDHQEQWKAFGKNHFWLPPAVRHDATHLGEYQEEYACDVAFVGSNGLGYHEDVWSYRKELTGQLRAMCQRNGWSWRNPGGDHPKVSRGKELNDFYASAKVTVGDSLCLKKESSRYWSDRVPETLGRGGRLIMPQIDALSEIYEHKLPMYEWGNFKHLEKIIEVYLKNHEDKFLKKELSFTHKLTAKNHTYVNRVKTMLEVIGIG